MKFGVLIFGVLGLLSLFIPSEGHTMFASLQHAPADLLIMLVGFGVPIAVAIVALSRPLRAPMAAAALGGFVLIGVKTKVWEYVPHVMQAPLAFQVFVLAIAGGVATAGFALGRVTS